MDNKIKTMRTTKSFVLELGAKFTKKLEDITINKFLGDTYNWIIKKSNNFDNNQKAKYAFEYALRIYSCPPIIYKEKPTIEAVKELAERLFEWNNTFGIDKDLSITAGSAMNQTLNFLENETLELKDLDDIFNKAESLFNWIKG